jgi:hypothetical protein
LDSPNLFLDVTRRHYVVMRAMYYGASTDAQLLLRNGADASGSAHNDHGRAYWQDRKPVAPIIIIEK